MTRKALHLGKDWEDTVPFSLGVVASGDFLYTAGITAREDNGALVGKGDMRAQLQQCFKVLGEVLEAAGASWSDVVKYTIFTTDIDSYVKDTLDIRKKHFVDRPAATLVEVSKLINPDMLVEIEAVVRLGKQ